MKKMDYEDMKYKMLKQKLEGIRLNEKQKIAYSLMARGENIFITGAAGVGKSFLIKLFKKTYNSSRIIAVTSLTGVSAILINGTTLHSYLGIGLGTGSIGALSTKILKKQYLRKRWLQLDCLIIDEISMLDPNLFDKLEKIARRVRRIDKPFGGIQLVLCGDFAQLPVVGKTDFCFESESWETCVHNTVYLTEVVRQDDSRFRGCLNRLRLGNEEMTQEDKDMLQSRVGVDLTNDIGIRPTMFLPTNAMVDEVNEEELDILADEGKDFLEFEMKVEVYDFKAKPYMIEKFIKDCPAIQTLQLCVGAQVMLLHNMNIDTGLVNGSRGIITSFVEDKPMVKFLNGIEVPIDYFIWEVEKNDQKIMSITQIPLRLGYAFTIHKCQGLTLDYAEVDLENIFEFGQSYCALSRVRTLEGLCIHGLHFDKIRCNPKVKRYYKSLE